MDIKSGNNENQKNHWTAPQGFHCIDGVWILWEPKNEHTINFKFKTNKFEFFELIEEMNNLGFYFLADYSTESNFFVDEERVNFISKLKRGMLAKCLGCWFNLL